VEARRQFDIASGLRSSIAGVEAQDASAACGPWAELRREFARRLVGSGELDASTLVRLFGGIPTPAAVLVEAVATAATVFDWRGMTEAEALGRLERLGGAVHYVNEHLVRRASSYELDALILSGSGFSPYSEDDEILDAATMRGLAAVRPHEMVLLLATGEDDRGAIGGNEGIYRLANTARRRARRAR
jgi:hypothetical protein